MLYEAKQGTKAYENIKSILDAEFEEHQAYMKRVEEVVGFKFEKYQGYQPNRTLTSILRKGAISAKKDEVVIIPMNMRDGSLICKGKGNKDWLCSAPHGAGRLMSRTQATKELSMDSYKNEMKGIYSTSVCEETIDEAPMAYKPTEEIVELIKHTVDVIDVIKPIYNFKAKL